MKPRRQKLFAGSGGDNHTTYFHHLDLQLVRLALPLIPAKVETFHLTLATLPLALINVALTPLLLTDLRWLWLMAATVLLHHFFDLLDGAVGRHRQTGLVRWGYFMDKFVDFIFVSSVCLALSYAAAPYYFLGIVALIGYGGLMVQSFLFFAAAGISEKTYHHFGPTELKVLLLSILVVVPILGQPALLVSLILGNFTLAIFLLLATYRNHRYLWRLERRQK